MKVQPHVYLALVHHPIVNMAGEVVTTSVTNLDVHDIARIARTYACKGYFVVTPIHAQRQMVDKLKGHWEHGPKPLRVHPRKQALDLVKPVETLDQAMEAVYEKENAYPTMVATSAKPSRRFIGFSGLKDVIYSGAPVMLVFGTGWGLAPQALERCNLLLEPINGLDGYNHLPVRAAVAIILDRLLTR